MERFNAWVLEQYAALASRVEGEEGQTLVEYGLLLALIAVVCVTAITGTGVFVTGLFTNGITPFP